MGCLRLVLFTALLAGSAAHAGNLRDLCPDRPGKGAPACTLDPGHVEYETSLADWTRDRSGGERQNTLLVADSLLRIGLNSSTEAQIAWTPWGHVRTRDRGGGIDKASGVGDVTLSIRHNLRNPDGSGTSIALQPFVSLPTGGNAIGDGDWGAGLTMPVSFSLPHDWQLAVVPTAEAAVNEDGKGRHFAYELATAVTAPLGDSGVSASLELWGQRDDDPSGRTSQYSFDLAAIWQPKQLANVQLDMGSYIGLNHNTPDVEILGGVAVRF